MNAKATTPAPIAKPKRTPDSFARIGKLARRLADLDADEKAELEQSPAAIRKKFADKRATAIEGHPAEIVEAARASVKAMRGEKEGETDA